MATRWTFSQQNSLSIIRAHPLNPRNPRPSPKTTRKLSANNSAFEPAARQCGFPARNGFVRPGGACLRRFSETVHGVARASERGDDADFAHDAIPALQPGGEQQNHHHHQEREHLEQQLERDLEDIEHDVKSLGRRGERVNCG
jgi:hypothetical protein